eukprot:8905284-Pyramimonas_sp.AAC.1
MQPVLNAPASPELLKMRRRQRAWPLKMYIIARGRCRNLRNSCSRRRSSWPRTRLPMIRWHNANATLVRRSRTSARRFGWRRSARINVAL